ncbi:MAG: flagellar motor switch protein FliG, partial [Planctomycetes bacterium]|nr:flagellar motor switch protein FliG [Planctomycetota bacterium]
MAKSVTTKRSAAEEEALSGTCKAAILMMALSADVSAKVLRLLDEEVVEEITREIASLDLVRPAQRSAVVEEFYNLALARQHVEQGGLLYAKSLLDKALVPVEAARILRQIEQHVFKKPFAFLAKTDAEDLLTFIMDEHPQTIALVLSHLDPNKASDVLGSLPQ